MPWFCLHQSSPCLEEIIGSANRIIGILHEPFKTKKLRNALPIDREARSRQGCSAHGRTVHFSVGGFQPGDVTLEHIMDGKEVMTQRGRLGRLGVGVRRHDRVLVGSQSKA